MNPGRVLLCVKRAQLSEIMIWSWFWILLVSTNKITQSHLNKSLGCTLYIAETISNSTTFHYSKPCDTLTAVCTRGSLPASTTNKDLLSQVEGQSTWARGAHRPEPRSFPGLGPLRSNMPATVRGDPPFTWDSTCFMVAFKAYELRHTGIWSLLGWDSTHLFCDHVQSRHPCPAAILTTILRVQGIYGFS